MFLYKLLITELLVANHVSFNYTYIPWQQDLGSSYVDVFMLIASHFYVSSLVNILYISMASLCVAVYVRTVIKLIANKYAIRKEYCKLLIIVGVFPVSCYSNFPQPCCSNNTFELSRSCLIIFLFDLR